MNIEEQLKKAFDPYFEAPIEIWKHFASLCELIYYKKNEIIKEAHRADRYGYFLLEGSVGQFVWKENNFICLDLFLENSFFADDISLMSGKPSAMQIVALEKSSVLRLSRSNIEKLKQTPMGAMLFMIGDQNAYAEKQKQQIEFMTKTAEERYRELMKSKPEILQRISQKHIASYLGITTQSLSRIRRKKD
ncbi:MAG: Crp/Fnr family transcriptional regulator [Cyclobacteriaceae bacterium]|nr:Crp/Fnr family transcriptional regulator [Cyclobacteriaceae bacterium]